MQLPRALIVTTLILPLVGCVQTTSLGGQEGEDWTDTGQDTGSTSEDTCDPGDTDTGLPGGSDTDTDTGAGPGGPDGDNPRLFTGTIRITAYAQRLAGTCTGPITMEGDGTLPPLQGGWSCAFYDDLAGLFPSGLDGILQGQWVEGQSFGGIFVSEGDQSGRWRANWTEGEIEGEAGGAITTVEPPITYTATFHADLQ